MFAQKKGARAPRLSKVVTAALVGTSLLSGAFLLAPSVAEAKTTSNIFSLTGAHSGTLKLTSSSLNCQWGKTYSGKGYLVTLSHMKGTISGAGSGEWTLTAYVPKKGSTHVASANVHSLTDTSIQSNAEPIISFYETSGTVTFQGSTGSVDLTLAYHPIGSSTYSGTTTMTGSWNCPNGLDLS